jgi:predicted nucleotidyltransferase
MTESLPDAIARCARFLEHTGRPYALIGGMAIVARVRVRLTEDLDVLVAAKPADLDAILQSAVEHGYSHDEGDRALFLEGLIRFRGPGAGVDVLTADSGFLREVIARARPVTLAGTQMPCATLEDLVLLKLEAERGIDVDDILAIKDAHGTTLDSEYLKATAERLGLDGRLDLYFGSESLDRER